jgi:cytochrome P450
MSTRTETRWEIGKTGAPLPPEEPGLPVLGVAHRMTRDPLQYFLTLYKKHGAIFRTTLLNREIVVMAGLDANHFLRDVGGEILSSEKLFGSFGQEFNTDKFLTAMDGEAHEHMRKQLRPGYSRSAMKPYTDHLIEIVDEFTRDLQPGDEIAVLETMRHIVTEQLGIVVAGRRPGAYFDDVRRFLNFNMNVNVLKMWPRLMLSLPQYKEAKAQSLELARQVLDVHRSSQSDDSSHDLIDDLLDARDIHGEPYDDDTLLATAIGPFFAGIDTVSSSLSFLLYNTLKYPAVTDAVSDEANGFFQDESPDLYNLKKMDTLHGTAIETLRMYPVAPFTPRVAKVPFEFHGYRVDAGAEIYFAQTVTHYLDEYFSDPYTFDPHRFENGRGEAGAFAPYTLGAHLCLGAGMAETQMMLILARLLHNLRLELPSPDYEVAIYASPLPNPGENFVVRVVENHTARGNRSG